MTFYNHAAKKPTMFNNQADATAWNQARTEERRAQRKLEREADPEWAEVRRIRQEIADRERAAKAAEKIEAEKHALVGWPAGLSAHIDRGSAKIKASFVRYLAQAVADYERDFPDQAPVPLIDVETAAIERREAESLARAREFFNPGADKAKLLAFQPAYVGDEEFKARHAARHALRQEAADPLESENPMEGETSPASTPAPVEAEPPKSGRGRRRKASKDIEMTGDGALFED